jgi:hypothetical protein
MKLHAVMPQEKLEEAERLRKRAAARDAKSKARLLEMKAKEEETRKRNEVSSPATPSPLAIDMKLCSA